MQITITLPDGSTRDHEAGVTAGEIAASIGRGLAKAALAARVSGDGFDREWFDLSRPITHDATVAGRAHRCFRLSGGRAIEEPVPV